MKTTRVLLAFAFAMALLRATHASGHSYDILHYELQIIPDFEKDTLALDATITITNPQLETEFVFGLNQNYDRVDVNCPASPVKTERNESWIGVTLEKPVRDVSLVFHLEGRPGKSVDENRMVIEDQSLFLLWSDRFYPIDFADWATVKTTLLLPPGFISIAPGKLMITEPAEKNVRHVFQTSSLAIDFSVFADTRWILTERDISGIHMQTLLHPQSQGFADQIFQTSSEILKFYSDLLFPYPFDQFSFVTIEGMFARRAFSGFVGYTPEYLEKEFTTTGHDAHETSLLWFGHVIRGSGPGGFQWMEGFGDYAEILYGEEFGKPLPAIFRRFRDKYLKEAVEKDFLYHELRGNTDQAFIHGKYPWLMHLVRFVIGDDAFRKAMKHVFRKHRYQAISMEEFVAALEEGSGQSLRWFREDWLERKGIPLIRLKTEIRETTGGFEIVCSIEQVGATYRLPIEIGIQTEGGLRIEKVNLKDPHAEFTFDSAEKPSAVTLDPQGWLLLQ